SLAPPCAPSPRVCTANQPLKMTTATVGITTYGFVARLRIQCGIERALRHFGGGDLAARYRADDAHGVADLEVAQRDLLVDAIGRVRGGLHRDGRSVEGG